MRRWLTYITVEGAFATVFIMFTGGAFLTGLALFFGADDFEIALLAAIPFLSQAAQIVSAYLVDHTGKRKSITVLGSFIGRQAWWIILPFLFIESKWRLEVLIALVIFSNISVMMATPGWLSWIAELVPDRIRARFFGVRNIYISISTIIATVVGGIIIDYFRRAGRQQVGFSIIIAIGALFALAALLLLKRLPDRAPAEIKSDGDWNRLFQPLRDRRFKRLLKIFAVWNIATGISAPFFVPHMLNNLKMSFTQISLYSSAAALIAIVLNKSWGKVIDRFGCKPVVAFCAFGISVIPLLWFIPRAGHLNILIFESVYSGLLWAGFNLAAFNIPIANSPRDGRTTYLAVFSVVTGLAFFAASLTGGMLAREWAGIHWHLANQVIINYHLVFGISSGLRLLAAFLTLSFKEPDEKGIPIMIQFVGYSILRRLSIGRQLFPWIDKRMAGEMSGRRL